MDKDLISRSALLAAFGEEPFVWDDLDRAEIQERNDWIAYTELVKAAPAVDAVEVVRCKDCEWWNRPGCAIYIVDDTDKPKAEDYCSFGVRRRSDD